MDHVSSTSYVNIFSKLRTHECWYGREGAFRSCITLFIRILNQGIPHDGCIFNNKFIYTVVNGKIIEINKNNFNEKKIIDLNKFQNDNKSLGWCRGFQKIDSKNYVAFSRIRPTKFIENVKWLGNKLSDKVKLKMPTRLVCYDENYSRLLKEINLEDYGINWIFSILKN